MNEASCRLQVEVSVGALGPAWDPMFQAGLGPQTSRSWLEATERGGVAPGRQARAPGGERARRAPGAAAAAPAAGRRPAVDDDSLYLLHGSL